MNNILKTTIRVKNRNPEEIFFKINHSERLNIPNNNEVNVFALNICNNKFSYADLFDLLKDNLGSYALSRREYDANPERAITKAIDKFREIKSNGDNGAGGELGELLLYIFLEYFLRAPKILSKVELKTTQNQYVFNADGVHFYQFENNDNYYYQLILGESKLKDNYKSAINKAFESITLSKLRDKNEINLITSEIFKETYSQDDAEKIKKLIIPNVTEDFNSNIYKSKAFAIFIGSDFKINSKLSIEKQRQETIEGLKGLTSSIVSCIDDNIKKYELSGYSFYVYFLPFNDIKKDKISIMDQLLKNDTYEEI